MTKNWDSEIEELSAAYDANRVARSSVRSEVQSKYRHIIADEIAERMSEIDYKFAKHLSDVKERTGLPVGVIQDSILRTRTWKVWEKWRDLAGIEPERISVATAKNAERLASAPFEWLDSLDDYRFVVKRNEKGEEIEPILVVVDSATERTSRGVERFSGDYNYEGLENYATFDKWIREEIKRAYLADEIPEILSPYEQGLRNV